MDTITRKPFASIMLENGKLVVTNGKTFQQERLDPKEFARANHNAFYSSKSCALALFALVGANENEFEITITPAASQMISQIYSDSIKLS